MAALRHLVLLGGLLVGGCASAPSSETCSADEIAHGCAITTELFFGLSRPDGTLVGDNEWSIFLANVVTPLFPDGFTVLPAEGQWREPRTGRLAHEPSKVLVIVHTHFGDDQSIAALVTAYKQTFLQNSVLRVDFKSFATF